MANFSIPDRYKQGFKLLIKLDQNSRDSLVSQLKTTKDIIDTDKLSTKLKISTLKENEVKQILDAISSMFLFKESTGYSTDEFTSELKDALYATKVKQLEPDKEIESFIRELLNLTDIPFYLNAKAKHLAHENNYTILDSRIFTDIRPIFTEDKDCNLKGYVVQHNLKLEYREGFEFKDAYFSLDKDSLDKLKRNINRAETKEKVIRKELKDKNTNIYN